MKKILLSFLIIGIAFFASCSEETPPPVNPVIGEWLVSSFEFTELSTEFSGWEGYNGTGYYGEQSYALVLNEDLTYSREIVTNVDTFTEDGDWDNDDDDLYLDPDGSGIGIYNEFKVVSVDAKDMVLSTNINEFLVPDIYYDTVSQAYRDNLALLEVNDPDAYDAELNKIFQLTSVTLVYSLDKTND